jgi:phenylacetate-CoA ligase
VTLRSHKDRLIKETVFRRRLELVSRRRRAYEADISPDGIADRQVERFNRMWARCLDHVPFYRRWRSEHDLPPSISSLAELDRFPPLTKSILAERANEVFQHGRIKDSVSTGGSTGRPLRFPTSPRDRDEAYASMYAGRSFWGLEPLDPMVAFWGHAHLFGSGVGGRIGVLKRRVADGALNIVRFNAYDLTVDSMARHHRAYLELDPAYVYGYTSCVTQLARYVVDNDLDIGRRDRLRAVILTSETVSPAAAELVSRAFGVPVVIEYGMAETGPLTYSRGETWTQQLLWHDFIARVDSDGVLHVTAIGGKLFPLVQYRTDDVVEPLDTLDGGVLSVRAVLGRKSETLSLRTVDGGLVDVKGTLIVHVLMGYPRLYSIQFEQLRPGRARVHLVADRPLDLRDVSDYCAREIRKENDRIDAASFDFVQAEGQTKTIAGKEGFFRDSGRLARVPAEQQPRG